MAVSAQKSPANDPGQNSSSGREPTLHERQTPELVFGMVGLVGAGVSTTAGTLKKILEEQYGYIVTIYKVSDIIKEHSTELIPDAGAARVTALQNEGSGLRERYGNDYLARRCVEKIAIDRQTSGGYDARATTIPIPRRHAHIIDSLKHEDEAKLLKDVYGNIFWLVTVFASENVRERRLNSAGFEKAELSEIKERDRDEGLVHGQHVQKCSELGDFFVRNNHESKDPLQRTVERYLEVLFDIQVHTPHPDESAMYAASSAASRSACLSRQVGAAIMSKDNELIGVGWNDVPVFGGGLYADQISDGNDHRCYRWGEAICHNDDRKKKLYRKITDLLHRDGYLSDQADHKKIQALLASTDIRNLIEYSRAVHAEMEAILSVGRTQKAGLVGATMYVTTFPCHSCARHIVAAGIRKVIFVEPYDKSLADDLHSDSVSTDERDEVQKVTFLQYEGVAPRNMIRLFNHGRPRKADGRAIVASKSQAQPICSSPLDSYATMEQLVVKGLMANDQNGQGSGDSNG